MVFLFIINDHNLVAYTTFYHHMTILIIIEMKWQFVYIVFMSKGYWFVSIVGMMVISLVFTNSIITSAIIYALILDIGQ